jgi:ATP-dependent DNA helicase RecQ
MGAAYRLLEPIEAPGQGIDWKHEETKHRADLDKLRQMQGYAYQRGCRRRYILQYFGEDGRWRCGACDRCLPSARRIIPGWSAPRRKR